LRAFDSVVRFVTGARGNIRLVRFQENGNVYSCYVWDDSFWVAVKDVVLLSVYERAGIELHRATGTVIDAGAHVGLFSARASCYAQEVIALEPNPSNFAILQLNVSHNHLENVVTYPTALWSVEEEIDFYEGSHSHSGSVVWTQPSPRPVQAITLEQLVNRHGHIALLKLDVEGAEFEVLMSTSDEVFHNVDAIVAELDMAPGRSEGDLRQRLEAVGYDVVVSGPPILSTAESLHKILTNWRKLDDAFPLKFFVLAVYLLEPPLRGLIRNGRRVRAQGPRYLFARRPTV
jgi:FkbM family methyltransferase